jgi:hypothetical protein
MDKNDQTHKDKCDSEINLIHATINSDQAEYDKQLLTLSSAFLGVSLGFIKDVVPLKDAICVPVLYTAYVLLIVCIGHVLYSYQYSIKGHTKAKEYWEKKSRNEEAEFPYSHAERIPKMNRNSGLIFGAGLLSLAVFVTFNIHHMR